MRGVLTRVGPDRFSGVYLGFVFVIVFGIWVPETFLTSATVHSVASQQAVPAMLALAIMFPLVTGSFDLSIGAVANFSAIFAVVLQDDHGWSVGTAIVAAVLAGALIGFVNGLFVVKFGVSSFIATLGSATVVSAFQSIVSDQGQPLPPSSPSWGTLTQHEVLGFQVVVLYLVAIALLTWWVLARTPVGRYMAAIGGNAEAARLAGVKNGRWIWLSLVVSSTLSALAGIFYASQTGPSLTFGGALLLPAFAGVFLGSTQIHPGRFNVGGTLIAVFVLAIGVKGMQLVTSAQWLNDMFNGIALLVAVSFAVWRQRRVARGDAEALRVSRRSRVASRSGAGPTAGQRPDANDRREAAHDVELASER